ncbi:hypothetical protein FOZ60_003584 [Perkinsus olseni]|uniref:Uncharacterized protein n=1 Tax=Perkinsus olseni TaxID=32597 RepID=A0A7J6NVW3_PEROL|nr:hypothetical protein FOZ60_003584 [Perkinsus olseni]
MWVPGTSIFLAGSGREKHRLVLISSNGVPSTGEMLRGKGLGEHIVTESLKVGAVGNNWGLDSPSGGMAKDYSERSRLGYSELMSKGDV